MISGTNQPTNLSSQSGCAWLSLVWAFVIGIISSGIVSYFVYVRQRRNDEKEQRDFIVFLYTLWKQGVHVTTVTERIEKKIDAITVKPDSQEKLYALDAEYQHVNEILWQAFRKKDKSQYFEAAVAYKEFADARAETAISQEHFQVLEADGKITIDRIKNTHAQMFPKGYAWAGTLRQQMISIVGNFQAAGRMINPSLSSYTVQLVPPNKVPHRLSALLQRWNDNVHYLQSDDLQALAEELAHFHHDFLLIHPFVDGNGRIARIILNEQTSFFMKKPVFFQFKKDSYYQALHLADMREPSKLSGMIRVQLDKPH